MANQTTAVLVRFPPEVADAVKEASWASKLSMTAWLVQLVRRELELSATAVKETHAKPTVKAGKKPLEIRTVSVNHKDTDDEY